MNLTQKLRGGEIGWSGRRRGLRGRHLRQHCDVADILEGHSIGNGAFSPFRVPRSQPAYLELVKNGAVAKIMAAGGIVRSAFCGPCFGADDTPANGEFSVRQHTRNFRTGGSKPGEGRSPRCAYGRALRCGHGGSRGRLTSATEIDVEYTGPKYFFDKTIYAKPRLQRLRQAEPETELQLGPNIKIGRSSPPYGGFAAEGGQLYHRSRHHHRRADPPGEDLLLPLESAQACRVYPFRKDPAYVDRSRR
jgi:aconitate hydratase